MTADRYEARAALEVRRLEAYYGKSQVIFDLDLVVNAGETVTVLGRNGAGKTTLLKALAGVVSARCEHMALGSSSIAGFPPFKRVRAGLSLVPSGSRAFPNLTVHENLSLAARGRSRTDGGWTLARIYEQFPILGRLRSSAAGSLSGGERQMLAVARSLIANPKVIMLDEPSEGLAPIIVRQIGEMLRDLSREGLAVLLTEQNYRLALDTADRAYFIEKGQVAWSGTGEKAAEPEVIRRFLAV
jgi:branched-chain amino acid transport system ATP-binding protein